MDFFEILMKFFGRTMSFLVITFLAANLSMSTGTGVNKINVFIVFFLWAFFVYLIIKGHPIISVIISFAVFIALKISEYGLDSEKTDSLITAAVEGIFLIIAVCLFFKWLSDSSKANKERNKRIRENKKEGRACCGRCGSTSIQYYSTGIPYRDYNGIIQYSYKQYHCNNCDYEW